MDYEATFKEYYRDKRIIMFGISSTQSHTLYIFYSKTTVIISLYNRFLDLTNANK